MNHIGSGIAAVALAAATASFVPDKALATEGYFLTGYGAVQKSLAGAGVANPEDATTLSLNPAGLVSVGRQFNGAMTTFLPTRSYTATGTGFIAPGTVQSDHIIFPIPSVAYSHPIDADQAFGVTAYGNGGLDTSYSVFNRNLGTNGVFGGGVTGADVFQMFISAGYARRLGTLSVGVAPVFLVQRFNAWGLSSFSAFSSDPQNLTDQSYAWAYGGGVRAGLQWDATPTLRFGVAGASPTYSTKFRGYSGLLADQGGFDVPANITAGVAYDVNQALTLLFDYKHIFYSSVGSVGNSSSIPLPFGASGGPGFGWKDVDVFRAAAEWRVTPDFTFRVGYSHNTNPVRTEDVAINILAPGIVTDHIAGGFSFRVSPNSTIDFAAIGVPRHTISGPVSTALGGGTVELAMHQFEATIGWTYKFDPVASPVLAKY
jgi:long-chain fatty acid transport protein